MGWAGISNGELLALAEPQFDVFMTADQNLQYQQNLDSTRLSIIVLATRSNRFEDLVQLIPKALEALNIIQPGNVVRVVG